MSKVLEMLHCRVAVRGLFNSIVITLKLFYIEVLDSRSFNTFMFLSIQNEGNKEALGSIVKAGGM